MTNEAIHVGDYGTLISITVMEDGLPKDISDATVIQFALEDPSGISSFVTGAFATDGTDGIVTYTLEDGDIYEAGIWKLQVILTFPSGEWNSNIIDLPVEASIEPEA